MIVNNLPVNKENFETFLDMTHMNFDVDTRITPVHPDILAINPDAKSGQYQIFRTDNGEVFHSGMSKQYHPIQNREALSFIKDLAATSNKPMEFVSGGIWKHGAQTFAQIKMGEAFVGNRRDIVEHNVTFGNSHNGTYSLKIVLTPLRVHCANQIGVINRIMAKGGAEISFNIRHKAGAIIQMEELRQQIRIIDQEFVNAVEDYNKLAGIKTDEEYVEAILNDIFPSKGERTGIAKENFELRVADVKRAFRHADGGRLERDTAWNLYNSIQGSIQHRPTAVLRHMKNVSNAGSLDIMDVAEQRLQAAMMVDRSQSILMGKIAQDSRLALESVMRIASSQAII